MAKGLFIRPDGPGRLYIGNTNKDCCSCDDFENVYKAMTRVYEDARGVVASAGSVGVRIRDPEDPIFGPSSIEDVNRVMEAIRDQRHRRRFFAFARPQPGKMLGIRVNFHNNPPDWPFSFEKAGPEFKITFSCEDNEEFVDEDNTYVLKRTAAIFWSDPQENGVEQWFPAELDEILNLEEEEEAELPELRVLVSKRVPEEDEEEPGPEDPEEEKQDPLQLGLIPPSRFISIYFEVEFFHPLMPEGQEIKVTFESTNEMWMTHEVYDPPPNAPDLGDLPVEGEEEDPPEELADNPFKQEIVVKLMTDPFKSGEMAADEDEEEEE